MPIFLGVRRTFLAVCALIQDNGQECPSYSRRTAPNNLFDPPPTAASTLLACRAINYHLQ